VTTIEVRPAHLSQRVGAPLEAYFLEREHIGEVMVI